MIRLRGEVIPVRTPFPDDDEGILRRFDRLCQMALKGEAINYYKYMDYRRKNEIMLSELSENELGKLYTEDVYSVENSMFDVLGYDIEVKDALLAEALKELTQRRRDVILLSFFMNLVVYFSQFKFIIPKTFCLILLYQLFLIKLCISSTKYVFFCFSN